MHFIKRERVCEIFKIRPLTSYRLFGSLPAGKGLLTDTSIVDVLNDSRKGGQPFVSDIPSDFLTLEEVSAEFGIEPHRLRSWCSRGKRIIPPHYRLNKHTIRFRLSTFSEWLIKTMKVKRSS